MHFLFLNFGNVAETQSLFLPTAGKWVRHCSAPSFFVLKKRFPSGAAPRATPRPAPRSPLTHFFRVKDVKIATQLAIDFSQRQIPPSARGAACRAQGAARVGGCRRSTTQLPRADACDAEPHVNLNGPAGGAGRGPGAGNKMIRQTLAGGQRGGGGSRVARAAPRLPPF